MRYHINKNNEPAPCHAKSPESCPCRGNGDVDENEDLIGNGHYDSLEEATRAVEHKLEMKNRGYTRQIKKTMSQIDPNDDSLKEEKGKSADDEANDDSGPADNWESSTDRMIRLLDSNDPVSASDLHKMYSLAFDDESKDFMRGILERSSIVDGQATTINTDDGGTLSNTSPTMVRPSGILHLLKNAKSGLI